MIGKILKTIFLTKEARQALERRQAAKTGAAKKPNASEALATSAAQLKQTQTDSLRQRANATELDRDTIRDALEAARLELKAAGDVEFEAAERSRALESQIVSRQDARAPKTAGVASDEISDHDALVSVAMDVFRQKQSALDDLDPESRKKLRLMANAMLGAKAKD